MAGQLLHDFFGVTERDGGVDFEPGADVPLDDAVERLRPSAAAQRRAAVRFRANSVESRRT